MRVTITGINFKYDNGYQQDFTSVELQYITSGFKFTTNKPIEISTEQYEANKDNTDGLRALVVDRKIVEVNECLSDLQTYRDSLEVEK